LSLFSASDGFVTTELFRYEQQYGGIFKVKWKQTISIWIILHYLSLNFKTRGQTATKFIKYDNVVLVILSAITG
jgi:hypothetical protein